MLKAVDSIIVDMSTEALSNDSKELYFYLDKECRGWYKVGFLLVLVTLGLSVIVQDPAIALFMTGVWVTGVLVMSSIMRRIGLCICGHTLRWHEDKNGVQYPRCKKCNCLAHTPKPQKK